MVENGIAWLVARLQEASILVVTFFCGFSQLSRSEFAIVVALVAAIVATLPSREFRDHLRGYQGPGRFFRIIGMATTASMLTVNFLAWTVPRGVVGWLVVDLAMFVIVLSYAARHVLRGLVTARRGWPGPGVGKALLVGTACWLWAAWGLPDDRTRLPFLKDVDETVLDSATAKFLAAANEHAAAWSDGVWRWNPLVRKLTVQPDYASTSSASGRRLLGVLEQSRWKTFTVPTTSVGLIALIVDANQSGTGVRAERVEQLLPYHSAATWWRSPLVRIAWRTGVVGRVTRWEVVDDRVATKLYVWLESASFLDGVSRRVFAIDCRSGDLRDITRELPSWLAPPVGISDDRLIATQPHLAPPVTTPQTSPAKSAIDTPPSVTVAKVETSPTPPTQTSASPSPLIVELSPADRRERERTLKLLDAVATRLATAEATIRQQNEQLHSLATTLRAVESRPSSSATVVAPVPKPFALPYNATPVQIEARVGRSGQAGYWFGDVPPPARPSGPTIPVADLFERGRDIHFTKFDHWGRPVLTSHGVNTLQALLAQQFPTRFDENFQRLLQLVATQSGDRRIQWIDSKSTGTDYSGQRDLERLLLERWRLVTACDQYLNDLGADPGIAWSPLGPPSGYAQLRTHLETWLQAPVAQVVIDSNGTLFVNQREVRISPSW